MELLSIERASENPWKINDEEGVGNILDKESKTLVIKMLTELGKRIDEHSENLKELENIERPNQK